MQNTESNICKPKQYTEEELLEAMHVQKNSILLPTIIVTAKFLGAIKDKASGEGE